MSTQAFLRLRQYLAVVFLFPIFLFSACSGPLASSSSPLPKEGAAERKTDQKKGEERLRYIVRLADPPLLAYNGGVPGLAPTNPSITGQRFDPQSPDASAYLNYLSKKQNLFKAKAEKLLQRELTFERIFHITTNAVVMRLSSSEASKLTALSDVLGVEPDRELKLHSDSPGNADRPTE